MDLFKDIERLERLHHLICRKGTGTPDQLADRLNTSRRNVFRMICELKSRGIPIAYDKTRGSYYYETEVTFIFRFAALSEDTRSVKGGQNFLDFHSSFFQSDNFRHSRPLGL